MPGEIPNVGGTQPAPRPTPVAPPPPPPPPLPARSPAGAAAPAADRAATTASQTTAGVPVQAGAMPVPAPGGAMGGSQALDALFALARQAAGSRPGPTAQSQADWDRLKASPLETAREQGGHGASQMALAMKLFQERHPGVPLRDGAEKYNLVELNQWVSQNGHKQGEGMTERFTTHLEGPLMTRLIAAGDGPPPRKVGMGELTAMALELSGGDVSTALLTTHNMLRAIARPNLETGSLWEVSKHLHLGPHAGPNRQEAGEAFMRRYLDGPSAGIRDPQPGESIGDDWYHTFVAATVSYVGNERNPLRTATDGLTARTIGPGSLLARLALPPAGGPTAGAVVAIANTIAEQGIYGFLPALFDENNGNGPDTILGIEPGEILAGMRGHGVADALARAT